jgi:hypothetical protein
MSEVSNQALALSKPSTPFIAEKKFRMDRAPYEENGQWYLVLDGLRLRKLGQDETSDYKNWTCP